MSNIVVEAVGPKINSSTAKWGSLPGALNSYYSSPDSSAASVTGDLDIRVKVAPTSWNGSSTEQSLVAKAVPAGNQKSYILAINATGQLRTYISGNGSTYNLVAGLSSSTAIPFADKTVGWVRMTFAVATGYLNYYTSVDGVTWTQLGNSNLAGTAGAIFDSTSPIEISGYEAQSAAQLNGRIYRAQIYNGINGTLAVDFNPNDSTNAQTWTSATTGETWTTNGAARVYGNTHATYGIPAYWDASGPLGYLAEGARQNVVTYSDLFTTNWGIVTPNLTVTAGAATSPQGTTNATSAVEAAVTSEFYRGQVITTTAVPWTFSVWAKLYGTTRPYFRIRVDDGTNNNAVQANFNISTQAVATGPSVTGTYSSATSSVVQYPNGWVRCILIVTPSASASARLILYTMDTDYATNVFTGNTSHAGDSSAGLYWSGAVAEIGSFVSSYIPTTTAAVTRPADVDQYVSAGNIASTSTISMTLTPSVSLGSTTVFHFGTYVDASNYTAILSDGTNLIARKRIGGANHDATIAWTRTINTPAKICARFDTTNGIDIWLNGTKGTNDATTTAAQIGTNFQIGGDGNGASQDFCEHRDFRAWVRSLPDANCSAIST